MNEKAFAHFKTKQNRISGSRWSRLVPAHWQFSLWHTVCRYSPKNPSLVSETVHYKRGVSQQFSMPSFKIDFSEWKEEDVSICSGLLSLWLDHKSQKQIISNTAYQCVVWFSRTWAQTEPQIFVSFPLKLNFDLDRGVFPMVIQAMVDEGDGKLLELHTCDDKLSLPPRVTVPM